MYPYMNEDVAWQRLQDLQREMETSRLWAMGERPAWYRWVARVPASLARLVGDRPAATRIEPGLCETDEGEAATTAA
ncbi:MAG TPA: hypothetical protein VEW68_07560 [Patescibacteria group bacterium]|nr:hypothetical protein [Patescibacteria group bacterium]